MLSASRCCVQPVASASIAALVLTTDALVVDDPAGEAGGAAAE